MRLGRLSAVLSACLLVGISSAQVDECTTSSAAGFDFQVSAETYFTIYWTVDEVAEEVTFQAVYEGEGWVGLGFSSDGVMVGADAVIGLPDEDTALEYDLGGYTLESVTEASLQEISGASVTQTASATSLVFTRPLAPTADGKLELSAEEGEEATFIWGSGSDNDLAFHANWGSVTVGDLFCATGTDDDDATDVATANSCESSDPAFDFEVAPADDLALFWRVSEDGAEVAVQAIYQGEGWVGIGFSDSGKMPGSDSVIGLPDEDTAFEYDMDNYNQPVEAQEQEITNATITQAGGTTTLTFTRLLEPVGDGKQVLTLTESTDWLYAWGGSNVFVTHTVDGSFSLSLTSCEIGDAGGGASKKEYAHAWLMVIGWSFCFPLGVMYARFSSNFAKVGFPAHRALQSVGTLCVLVGFFLAVAFTDDFGRDHFENGHGKFGLVLTIYVVVQVVAAIFRPHAPPKESLVTDVNGNMVPEPPTRLRKGWSLLHKGLGYVFILLAVVQCFGGFDYLPVDDTWEALYAVVVAVMVLAFLVLSLSVCCTSKSKNGVRSLSNPQLHAADAGTRR